MDQPSNLHKNASTASEVREVPSLDSLSEEQQNRLGELLDGYLSALEEHEAPDREQIKRDNQDIAGLLDAYFEKLDELQIAATGGTSTPGSASGIGPTESDGSMAGQQLGDYLLVQEIGRGGMGIVFSALDNRLHRRVAVKLLPMAALLDEKHIERFKNEARAAANLDHSNIVPVYSIGEQSGIHFYAMQQIDGPSLDRRIEEHRLAGTQPPIKNVLRQFSLVADALHSAHEHGIIHRDIKPSNLILDGSQKLWIADFGLARVHSESALTKTGEMVGTFRYMSPEQASGRNELVDHRTDVYSLGITLYELLTLRSAMQGSEGPGLLRSIESEAPTPLSRLRPDVSRELQIVVEKAISKRKEDRYESAAAFAADLKNLVDGRPISARAVSPVVKLTRIASAHALGLLVTCCLLLVAAIALVTGNLMIMRESRLREQNLVNARTSVEELAKVADELVAVPGAEQLRRTVLNRTLRYYQDFALQASEDEVLHQQIANAYSKMGTIQEELGNPGEAIGQYQCAEAIYARLTAMEPNNEGYALQRSRNLNRLGLALAETGKSVQAVQTLEATVDQLRESEQGADPARLALTLNNLGLVLQKGNRPRAAGLAFNESIQLLRAAMKSDPHDPEIARGLAAAYQNVGTLISDSEASSAIEHLQSALQLQLQLAASAGAKGRSSRDLVGTYLHLGRIYLDENRLGLAKGNLGEAARLVQQLVSLSPQVATYQRDLAVVMNNLGMTEMRLGNQTEALRALELSEVTYRKLAERHKTSPRLRESLAITLNNKGLLLEELGDESAAEVAFQEASDILELALDRNPTLRNRDSLRQVYINRSRILYAAGRDHEAAELVERHTAMLDGAIGSLERTAR